MKPLVGLEAVGVTRDGRAVLDHVSLSLYPKERLAIVGPNGAGKTTLLRTLVGLESATKGHVTLFDRVCAGEADFRVARRRIGFLFQDSDDQLFCPTVIEDVAFGPLNLGQKEADADATARTTLERLGLAHLADRITYKLSGGEKRLVCLAGLLAMSPDILLLDEPTNGVDAVNGALLERVLLSYDVAMILVSHDEDFVTRLATRGMLLSEGRLSPAEIHSHPHVHTHPHLHRA